MESSQIASPLPPTQTQITIKTANGTNNGHVNSQHNNATSTANHNNVTTSTNNNNTVTSSSQSTLTPPPVVYGELSILGYNSCIPHVDKNCRRNRSKFLLCKRPESNGIQKSRHYIVKQPQDNRAILDKECHSISFTFSRSQAVIVEYVPDSTTDMFQIGRSSENPIDFVVMDTLTNNNNAETKSTPYAPDQRNNHTNLNENEISNHQQQQFFGIHRQLVKVGDEFHRDHHPHPHQPVLLSYPQQNLHNSPALYLHNYPQQLAHSSGLSISHQQHQNQHQSHQKYQQQQQHHHHSRPGRSSHATQSTISRFACRIIVERSPPFTARIYAAGFDSSKNIFLGEKATKWEQNETIDGLTTNGVLLMHPKNGRFSPNKEATHNFKTSEGGGVWREVSVDGGIYAIRESRSAPQKGTRIASESNILQDGTLIDLCGATLLWRSIEGFKSSPTKKSLEAKIDLLNASRPQCPVGLNTLVIPRRPILTNHQHRSMHKEHNDRNSHQPYVYLKCGHVQGFHNWGTTEKSNQRTCPICLSVGAVVRLSMGLEPSFYVDSGPLTHVFNPCGHMASEKTIKYWCTIKIPHGTHFFHSICPFCATPLETNDPPSTRLIFQDDLD